MSGGLAVFDLDGTLHHTEKALTPAIRMALGDLGVTGVPDERINSLYGEPIEVFATELLGGRGTDVQAFRERLGRHQVTNLPRWGELYPGVDRMLEEAQTSGWMLAVLSNSGLAYIELVTGTLGIRDRFTHLVGRNGDEASKTARLIGLMEISGSSFTVMAGDRYHDLQAARGAGITSIACAYGYGSPGEMSGADHVVRSAGEITTLLQTLRMQWIPPSEILQGH